MKKNKLIPALLALQLSCLMGQAQNWQWAKQLGSVGIDISRWLSRDNNGSIYVSGYFGSPYGIFGDDTVQCQGFSDIFLSRYDMNGNEIWTVRGGRGNNMQNEDDYGKAFYDSVSNHIYLCGSYMYWATFGSFTVSGAGTEMFLAKFDTSGNCIWVKDGGGLGGDAATSMTFDELGNIYLIGNCSDTATFDSIIFDSGRFIAKYDSSGDALWVKRIFPLSTYTPPQSIQYFDNDLFICGFFTDTIINGTDSVFSHGSIDGYIARFDSSGNVKWIKNMGGPGGADCEGLSLDQAGNIYIVGTFNDTIYFDTTMLVETNGQDLFIAKYDSSGDFQWAQQAFTTTGPTKCITSDANGYTYVSGHFSNSATFGIYNISTSNSADMFVARYSPNGTCMGVVNFGHAAFNSVIADGTGAFYAAGYFLSTVNIGSTTLTTYGSGFPDIYLAKHDELTGDEEEERLAYSNSLLIYANPNTGKCTVKVPQDFLHESNLVLSIFDSKGSLIQRTPLEMNDGKIKLNIEAQARGMYNVTLSNGRKSYNGRIVFE